MAAPRVSLASSSTLLSRHADDPLRVAAGHLGVVGDQDHRLPALVELLDDVHHLVAAPAVEGAGRLVGQDHRRTVDQCSGDRRSLPLAPDRRPG